MADLRVLLLLSDFILYVIVILLIFFSRSHEKNHVVAPHRPVKISPFQRNLDGKLFAWSDFKILWKSRKNIQKKIPCKGASRKKYPGGSGYKTYNRPRFGKNEEERKISAFPISQLNVAIFFRHWFDKKIFFKIQNGFVITDWDFVFIIFCTQKKFYSFHFFEERRFWAYNLLR